MLNICDVEERDGARLEADCGLGLAAADVGLKDAAEEGALEGGLAAPFDVPCNGTLTLQTGC